ncbi:unnamed protein product [Rotaria socialis]|uniref:Uncharacterized protein n=1 Tax=Rotaria socialis TaxID=392032 RepID=A0A820PT17_9BILA|nr:unnamed protein product [Rotaria socialis]CAF4318240.1 unnamed protein product [Rotaria socialis]CAF4409826.1 unnamed protein product [Rotaria socialis]
MDFLRIFTIKPIDADDMASQQTQSYLKTSLSRSTWQAWESITVIPCLTKDRLSIYSLHRQACLNHRSFYTDPTTKLQVLTRYAHLQRGNCCGNRCRHCPYGHINVEINLNQPRKIFNTSYYE